MAVDGLERFPVQSAPMNEWASMIQELRALGLRSREIAEEVGLSPTALSDIASGRTTEPRGMAAVKLYALAKSRGCLGTAQVAA